MEDANHSLVAASRGSSNGKRKHSSDEPSEAQKHTRTYTACDACRTSKTRCDATRPVCAKCAKRGRTCVYPEKDPFSIFEVWGNRLLAAIENQGSLLRDVSQCVKDGIQHHTAQSAEPEVNQDDDPEAVSRKDVSWTPIASSDKILDWSVFPREKPVITMPASSYEPKPNPFAFETANSSPARIRELRDIFISKIEPYYAIIDIEQLDVGIAEVLENGFGWSASSCLVLLVLALAAIWGNYPDEERRLVLSDTRRESYTVGVPEHRLKESSVYFAMAQNRMSAALLDPSLLSVTCFCVLGSWHQYNFEPIQGWKMFRTASMLWETYNMKHSRRKSYRPTQEESLEQRLYWTCLKAECELRHELPDLPPCTLQEAQFPFPLPTFPVDLEEDGHETIPRAKSTPLSHYYFLAEVSIRRLLNRARHAASQLSPNIDSSTASRVAESLHHLEDQLQQWLECLPSALRFSMPPDARPAPDELELVKLMRERYVEAREFLYRVFLYICLHGGARLTPAQAITYGAKASAGLRLIVYQIQTEKPFFRHMGSWIGCRVRLNQALCLVAAARGKGLQIESARYIDVPSTWREYVCMVRDRLETWSDQGAGVPELAALLKWLLG